MIRPVQGCGIRNRKKILMCVYKQFRAITGAMEGFHSLPFFSPLPFFSFLSSFSFLLLVAVLLFLAGGEAGKKE